jgi:hypothetical protein
MERLPNARAPGVRHLGREGLRRNAARGLAISTEISYTPAAAKPQAARQPCSSCCCRSARAPNAQVKLQSGPRRAVPANVDQAAFVSFNASLDV